MRILNKAAVLLVASTALATASFASSISFNATIPNQPTDFVGQTVSIPQFDPTLGTLTSVVFSLTGTVDGSIQLESLDAAPSTVTSALTATISLLRPDSSALVVVIPVSSNSNNLSAFDGTIDFGGTSGVTLSGLTNTVTNTATDTTVMDFALFTGVGNILLPVSGNGHSSASGAGNLIAEFHTNASAGVQVTYNYTPFVTNTPEPTTFAMFGLGIAMVGASRLRKRS